MIKIPVPKLKFKIFALTALSLWLIGTVAGFASPAIDLWWINIIKYISNTLLSILVLWMGWKGLVLLSKFVAGQLLATEDININLSPDLKSVREQVENISDIITGITADSAKASNLLKIAETETGKLVKLAKNLSGKLQAMELENHLFKKAIDAIKNDDKLTMAEMSGAISDEMIRELLAHTTNDDQYWVDTARIIASQLGANQQWINNYRQFSASLMNEIAVKKSQLVSMQATLQIREAASPMLLIDDNLRQSQIYLNIKQPASPVKMLVDYA